MSVFNSLGSNYNFSFAINNLFSIGAEKDKRRLIEALEKKYCGEVILFYKGRQAIELALKKINIPGKSVAVTGFTCLAVAKAVEEADMKAVYLDIDNNSLNFSPETLRQAVNNNPNIEAVIMQNTLGFPQDAVEIAKICKDNDLVLIEDLAHSVGAQYINAGEAGSVGDFVALSFSQEKIIDGVSGGALIIRNDKFKGDVQLQELPKSIGRKDRFYPVISWKIRKTYSFGLGKIIHKISRKLHFFNNPVVGGNLNYELTNWHCKAINTQLNTIQESLNHRKDIAKIYLDGLLPQLLIEKEVNNSSCLRFPIVVSERDDLVDFLKRKGIFISDIWYDAAVAPKKYEHLSDYIAGTCPVSDAISAKILNLPTHRNVSRQDAIRMVKNINLWGENHDK